MPVIGGRYYMNPQYGMAVERNRAADPPEEDGKPSWLDQFLVFVSGDTDNDTNSARDGASDDIVPDGPEDANAGELIAQNQNSEGKPQDQSQKENQQPVPKIAETAEKYNDRTDWAFAARKGA